MSYWFIGPSSCSFSVTVVRGERNVKSLSHRKSNWVVNYVNLRIENEEKANIYANLQLYLSVFGKSSIVFQQDD